MKKLLLLCAIASLATTASAQIIYTDLVPDSSYTITPSGTYSADSAIWLDIDGDNTDDFYFQYEYIIGFAGTTWKVQMHCIDPNNEGYWKSTTTSFGNHYLKSLKAGDSITSNVLFGTDYNPLLGDHVDQNMVGAGDKYIGIKFKSGANTYYGWILINLSFGASSGTLDVKSYAYNSTPGDGLNAGDTCLVTTSTTTLSDCDSVIWNGKTYKQSGTYTYKTSNAYGCDSIATLHLSINKTTKFIKETACDSFTLNSTTYYSTGVYQQVLTNSVGCDSTIVLDLTINNPTHLILPKTACDSFELNDSVYYSTGIYVQHLTNVAGCDSTITLDLTINKSSSSTLNITACDQYELNGVIYPNSGVHIQTITNAANCDSVITLNLTINSSTFTAIFEEACDSFKLNDSTYYSTGVYTQTFTNSKGCDSIVTLDLTINHPTSETINATACSSYTLNGTTYNQSGTYIQNTTNVAGCDSTITLVLTIGSLDKTVTQDHNTLTAVATGVDYQWLDCNDNYSEIAGADQAVFTPTVNGDYAVEISDGTCKDTSACFAVTKVGIQHTNFPTSITAYPNPTNGAINLDLGTAYNNVKVTVYNALGEKISEDTYANAAAITTNINGRSGVYYINISTESYTAKVKVLKQ